MAETVAVKIGDRPVAARTKAGGWEPHTTYDMPKIEGQAIVEAKLGSYARGEEKKQAEKPDKDKK